MKKYTKKITKNYIKNNIKNNTKKIKQWHKVLDINNEKYTRKEINKTKKKICYKNTSLSRICESAKYTTYRDHLYNTENIAIVNKYVSLLKQYPNVNIISKCSGKIFCSKT